MSSYRVGSGSPVCGVWASGPPDTDTLNCAPKRSRSRAVDRQRIPLGYSSLMSRPVDPFATLIAAGHISEHRTSL